MEKGLITRGKISKYVRAHKSFERARKSLVFRNPLYPSVRAPNAQYQVSSIQYPASSHFGLSIINHQSQGVSSNQL